MEQKRLDCKPSFSQLYITRITNLHETSVSMKLDLRPSVLSMSSWLITFIFVLFQPMLNFVISFFVVSPSSSSRKHVAPLHQCICWPPLTVSEPSQTISLILSSIGVTSRFLGISYFSSYLLLPCPLSILASLFSNTYLLHMFLHRLAFLPIKHGWLHSRPIKISHKSSVVLNGPTAFRSMKHRCSFLCTLNVNFIFIFILASISRVRVSGSISK